MTAPRTDAASGPAGAPLVTVIPPQSMASGMFARDLAAGKDPEALYTKAAIESVAISGCRASLALELHYPGGRSLHYVSSWVRPFDRALLRRTGGGRAAAAAAVSGEQPHRWPRRPGSGWSRTIRTEAGGRDGWRPAWCLR